MRLWCREIGLFLLPAPCTARLSRCHKCSFCPASALRAADPGSARQPVRHCRSGSEAEPGTASGSSYRGRSSVWQAGHAPSRRTLPIGLACRPISGRRGSRKIPPRTRAVAVRTQQRSGTGVLSHTGPVELRAVTARMDSTPNHVESVLFYFIKTRRWLKKERKKRKKEKIQNMS